VNNYLSDESFPEKGWELSDFLDLKGFAIEWLSPSVTLLSRRNRLYRAASVHDITEPFGSFPAPLWRRLVAQGRLGQRLLRFMYFNVLPLEDGSVFVTFDRQVGIISDGVCYPLAGLHRPCRVLRSGCAKDRDGSLVFGEYLLNPERGPVRIYRYVPGSLNLEVIYEFEAGSIRHVHGVHFDPYTQSLWLVSGDLPGECRMMRTSDQFQTFDVVGGGNESWRCLSPLFTEKFIYYATDSEFQQNYIYRLDRSSGHRHMIAKINGPAYYSTRMGEDMFFATTAEFCPSQQGRSAVIWHVRDNAICRPIATFEKDPFSVKFFMAGLIHFPNGPGIDEGLYFNGVALSGADNRTLVLRSGRH
jgi:hypothetical protein